MKSHIADNVYLSDTQPHPLEGCDTIHGVMSNDDPATVDGCATALLDMARGAAAVGEHALAGEAARRSEDIATSRGEEKARAEAEALQALLRSAQAGDAAARPETPSYDEVGDALAVEIIAGLNASSDA